MSAQVAVVGLACRFPGAPSANDFWDLVASGRRSFIPTPETRWRSQTHLAPLDDPRQHDRAYTGLGAYLEDIDAFAAEHYRLPPRRMEVTDPQHRLLIEVVGDALADAGYETRPFPRERTGVFVGISTGEYGTLLSTSVRLRQMLDGAFGDGSVDEATRESLLSLVSGLAHGRAFSLAGNLNNMAPATVSQVFDLQGPSFALDAACASSLLAVHEASLQLESGRCDVAVVGGVYLNLAPETSIGFCRAGAISLSGDCTPFDESADGFLMGEGVGVVVLRRLDDAIRSGDHVRAVVRGSAATSDGRGVGPMAPAVHGQVRVIQEALRDAGVPAVDIGLVEAHGTGTPVGDAAELTALQEVFADHRPGAVLSSVKANIGHCLSAAGIAGFIKTVLAVEKQTLPAHVGVRKPHEALTGPDSRLRLLAEAEPWHGPRLAGVSAFGFGGTNVHVVVGDADHAVRTLETPARQPWSAWTQTVEQAHLVVVSAPTPSLLKDAAAAAMRALTAPDGVLEDVARALARRRLQQWRLAFTARSREQAIVRLQQAAEVIGSSEPPPAGLHIGEALEASAFVLFPGQGAQSVGMLADVVARWPRLARRLSALCEHVEQVAGPDLLEAIYPSTGPDSDRQALEAVLASTDVCQPALAVTQVLLLELLTELGIAPRGAAGHSFGEFTAAAACGLIDVAALLGLAVRRGAMMSSLTPAEPGGMLAAAAGRDAVSSALEGLAGVWPSNCNSARQTTVSGTAAGLAAAEEALTARGLRYRRLVVSHPFHCPLMSDVDDAFTDYLSSVELVAPSAPLVSCFDGAPYPDVEAVRQAWRRHATTPVMFASVLGTLGGEEGTLIEVGTGTTLTALVNQALGPRRCVSFGSGDADSLLDTLADLACRIASFSAAALYDEPGPVALLDPAPLVRGRYWGIKPDRARPRSAGQAALPPADTDATPAVAGHAIAERAWMPELLELFDRQNSLIATALGHSDREPAPPRRTPAPGPSRSRDLLEPAATLQTRSTVLELVGEVSGFPPGAVRADQTLVGDLGFDSLLLTDLADRLSAGFPGVSLNKGSFDVDTTVSELVAFIAGPVTDDGQAEDERPQQAAAPPPAAVAPEYDVSMFPEVVELRSRLALADEVGVRNPFFSVHDAIASDTTVMAGRTFLNFSSYNYLGLSGHTSTRDAAVAAIEKYGTSVSASRMLSGEKTLHAELEARISSLLGTEDSVTFLGGHTTNVNTIGHLVGRGDLVITDELAHNSILEGCRLSGALRRSFLHNDPESLDRDLTMLRNAYRRVLVVVEGVYSMDGDIARLPEIVEVCKRHQALLMVDEAHSIGVLGDAGRGVGEYFGLDPQDVDIWMGTLSKSLASCGGYVAGRRELIQYLKYTAPGFIYSVGMSPSNTGAAIAAMATMLEEPTRLLRLHDNARYLLMSLQAAGVDTGDSLGTPIIPVITADSLLAARLSAALHSEGINVNPIFYPAVPEALARLRFFVTSEHAREQLDAVAEAVPRLLSQLSERGGDDLS